MFEVKLMNDGIVERFDSAGNCVALIAP